MSAVSVGSGVGTARPRLVAGVRLVDQSYRGEPMVIARVPGGGKYFRFRPHEARVLRAFDGTRTPAEIAAALAADGVRVGAAAVEGFARRLAALGVVERSLAERSVAQLERLRAERGRRLRGGVADLLRVRRSVGDPDAFLTRTLPWLRWCFTPAFAAASAALFALYVGVLVARWPAFVGQVAATYLPGRLTLGAVALLWLVNTAVSVVHELGHGYACKRFGGEVHEIGVMLLYFQPAFYCNVNDAWGFSDRAARLWVTAAGTWVELVTTSLCALVWWAADPSTLVSRVALAVMLLGGVTSVLTNANPLIPLDGYYALSDWLDVPNLRHRASAHLAWWLRRRVLRLDVPEPDATPRERRLFLIYGALSAAYVAALLTVTARVLLDVAGRALGAAGVVLALVWLGVVLRGRVQGLLAHRALIVRRARAAVPAAWRRRGPRLALGGACLTVAALVLPWPVTVVGTFVAAPARAQLAVAPTAGVVAEVRVRAGERVAPGTPLVRVVDLAAARALSAAERAATALADSEATARALGTPDAARLAARRAAAAARATALRDAADGLVRARWSGVVLTARPEMLLGRRVAAGAPLLRLGDVDSLELRIALPHGGGYARVGERVRLFTDAAGDGGRAATLASVAPAAGASGVEARTRLDARRGWLAGAHGEARVEVARSTLAGALWWGVRVRLRDDMLL